MLVPVVPVRSGLVSRQETCRGRDQARCAAPPEADPLDSTGIVAGPHSRLSRPYSAPTRGNRSLWPLSGVFGSYPLETPTERHRETTRAPRRLDGRGEPPRRTDLTAARTIGCDNPTTITDDNVSYVEMWRIAMRKVETTLVDDITGEPADETVRFALDDKTYEIDLASATATELRAALAGFIESARPAGKLTPARPRRGAATTAARERREQLEKVRAWAAEHNITIAPRGRVSQTVIEAFQAGKPEMVTAGQ
jgi:hypothetical protein